MLYVCVEILWPSQPIRVMLSVVRLPNHTFPGQALSSKQLNKLVLVCIPSPEKICFRKLEQFSQSSKLPNLPYV